jgi:corrinoid protein of di/trimethylamine methyltransferase
LTERLAKAVVDGDTEACRKGAEEALKVGMEPLTAINEGLMKGTERTGKRYESGEIFLSDMMRAADAMQAGINVLMPHVREQDRAKFTKGRIVIGTMKGDIHDIGKNLVSVYLQAASFDVHDLGVDIDPMKFIEKGQEVRANILGLSALMTSTRGFQREVVSLVDEMNLRQTFLVIVGGAVATPEWAREVKADGYGRTCVDAVELCRKLMSAVPPLREPILICQS